MAIQKWVSDPTHSELQFKVKHLMISKVTGSFTDFSVSAESASEDFHDAKINATIKLNSVVTGQPARDTHLKSADFFDVDQFAEMTFQSTSFKKENDEDFLLNGDLTIKGITKPVQLKVSYGGTAKDPWGNIKAAFSLSGKISRKEWGLTYNAPLEAGGVVISDEVTILGEIQTVQEAEQPA